MGKWKTDCRCSTTSLICGEDLRRQVCGKTNLASAVGIFLQKSVQRFGEGGVLLGGSRNVERPARLCDGLFSSFAKSGERLLSLLEVGVVGLQRLHTVRAEEHNQVVLVDVDIVGQIGRLDLNTTAWAYLISFSASTASNCSEMPSCPQGISMLTVLFLTKRS